MQNKMTAPPLQGISNLMKMQGRMGDSELVHMSPMEVKGLSSLGRLTRNPDTGLPEAFSIGGFFRDIVGPIGATLIAGPAGGVTYSMANTASKGGDFGDIALAGLTTYAGGKLGEMAGAGLSKFAEAGTKTGATAAGKTAEALGESLAQPGFAVGPGGTSIIRPDLVSETGKALSPQLGRLGQNIVGGASPAGEVIGRGISSSLTPGQALETMKTKGLSGLMDIAKEGLTPEGIGGSIGRSLGSSYADAALELQQQGIPEQVKEADNIESNQKISTGKLQSMNPQYADKDLSASRIVGAMQGTQAPLQFTDPSYSPAVTGNLSSILGAKNGGAMSNLKERAMGSQSKGLADALESITEGAEDIVDMGGGQVYFEGMVKGDGDGMSDEIPFSIEGQQPALLSRDEYVLPADVVAALGNGSSNAGADMLDKFMTDVREKTMGRERQINQIG